MRLLLRYMARSPSVQSSPQSIPLGYELLRKLSAYRSKLEKIEETHRLNSIKDIVSSCPYHVGDPILHIASGCRGIVVSWRLDTHLNKFMIKWMPDFYDVREYKRSRARLTFFEDMEEMAKHIQLECDADLLTPIHDVYLTRIHHLHVNQHFRLYNASIAKYLPTPELRYKYPLDVKHSWPLLSVHPNKAKRHLQCHENM